MNERGDEDRRRDEQPPSERGNERERVHAQQRADEQHDVHRTEPEVVLAPRDIPVEDDFEVHVGVVGPVGQLDDSFPVVERDDTLLVHLR